MGTLINIDNGGTLTDICVIDGDQVTRTKTLTTPFDLSKCLFEGLTKVSEQIYGRPNLRDLLLSADHIRYSTTQGTNALVERKGPRLGLLVDAGFDLQALRAADGSGDLFATLVGERRDVVRSLDEDGVRAAVVAINRLVSEGANRLVVAFSGPDRAERERAFKNAMLRKFPPQMLGAVPILYTHELSDDARDTRRAWTALLNAFLHPAMERFLYSAEHRLKAQKAQNPLLIFRNDGDSARVARTAAIKSYSSGPRGGLEGARALARHYGLPRLLSMDIGGTTTDVGVVEQGEVREEAHGAIEGVRVSMPLCDLASAGVGGSSIIRAEAGEIQVGPESVGSEPGPACFGLGGTRATITDAFLAMGLLDPRSYFGGDLQLDTDRARRAIDEHIAQPLGLSIEQAAERMEAAWVSRVAEALNRTGEATAETTLAAFGGAGPFVVCKVAEAAGIRQVLIPGLAAVFSAFGVGFSNIAHEYEVLLDGADQAALDAARTQALEQARRGMFSEGFALEDCELRTELVVTDGDQQRQVPVNGHWPDGIGDSARIALRVTAIRTIAQPHLSGQFSAVGTTLGQATSDAVRSVLIDGQIQDVPVYRIESQCSGVGASGPAVLEEAFFTCRLDPGWTFEFNDSGDMLLRQTA